MFYFKYNDDVIEKYKVNFDKDKIENLKKEIINNCSIINHIEYESDYSPKFVDEIIRNFLCVPTGKTKEYFEESRKIYLYSYDEYIPPYLVKLINELLNDNSKIIDEILNYDVCIKSSVDDKIEMVNQEFNKIDFENTIKKIEKLKELELLLKEKELNSNQKNIYLYYIQLVELIRFDLIDKLSISELDRVESFLEIELANKIINGNSKEKAFVKTL